LHDHSHRHADSRVCDDCVVQKVTDGSKTVIRHHGVSEALNDPKEVEEKLGDTILLGDKSAQSHNVEQYFGTGHRGKHLSNTDKFHREKTHFCLPFLYSLLR
jgi:hypothetical protein